MTQKAQDEEADRDFDQAGCDRGLEHGNDGPLQPIGHLRWTDFVNVFSTSVHDLVGVCNGSE